MIVLLLVFLSIWSGNASDQAISPKCPQGFHLTYRVPTARNSFTPFWCLAVVPGNHDIRNREWARSLCDAVNSTLSIPENEVEAKILSGVVDRNISIEYGFAMDGEITAKCKSKFYKDEVKFSTLKGECSVEEDLFEFQDHHTDPTFIKKHFSVDVPSANYFQKYYEGGVDTVRFKELAGCAVLTRMHNTTKVSYADVVYCHTSENDWTQRKVINALCGRLPEGQ